MIVTLMTVSGLAALLINRCLPHPRRGQKPAKSGKIRRDPPRARVQVMDKAPDPEDPAKAKARRELERRVARQFGLDPANPRVRAALDRAEGEG